VRLICASEMCEMRYYYAYSVSVMVRVTVSFRVR